MSAVCIIETFWCCWRCRMVFDECYSERRRQNNAARGLPVQKRKSLAVTWNRPFVIKAHSLQPHAALSDELCARTLEIRRDGGQKREKGSERDDIPGQQVVPWSDHRLSVSWDLWTLQPLSVYVCDLHQCDIQRHVYAVVSHFSRSLRQWISLISWPQARERERNLSVETAVVVCVDAWISALFWFPACGETTDNGQV